jgi:hypothetical protein
MCVTAHVTCRLKNDDPFLVNDVFTSVWNFMGLYPLLYAAILIPGARSNKVTHCAGVLQQIFTFCSGNDSSINSSSTLATSTHTCFSSVLSFA